MTYFMYMNGRPKTYGEESSTWRFHTLVRASLGRRFPHSHARAVDLARATITARPPPRQNAYKSKETTLSINQIL